MKKYTHDKAGAGADHEHGGRTAQATFFIQSMLLVAFEEDVRNSEAHAGEDEVEQGTCHSLAVLGEVKIGVVDDILGKRLVRAEVLLSPVCYPDRSEYSFVWGR